MWKSALMGAAITALVVSPALAVECDMAALPNPGGSHGVKIYASNSGVPALYFRADMDVNTDGTARSYHPQDPLGQTLALNNIVNALTYTVDDAGQVVSCTPKKGACFMRYIHAFEFARDRGWPAAGPARISTKNIIPWRHDAQGNRIAPCTIPSGPYAGYFVSMTAWTAYPKRPDCDQDKWIDALTLNAIVIPGGSIWRSQSVLLDGFDAAVVRDRATGRVAYAMVGDTGPGDSIGEGSVALAARMHDYTLTGQETYKDIKALALGDVDYLMFPTYDLVKREGLPLTEEKIERVSKAAFEAWGGQARLDACKTALAPAGR